MSVVAAATIFAFVCASDYLMDYLDPFDRGGKHALRGLRTSRRRAVHEVRSATACGHGLLRRLRLYRRGERRVARREQREIGLSLELVPNAERAELVQSGRRPAEQHCNKPGCDGDAPEDDGEDGCENERRDGQRHPEQRHETLLPARLRHLDPERMLARAPDARIAAGDEPEPRCDLPLIAEVRRHEPMESTRDAAEQQRDGPARECDQRSEQAPNEQDDVVREGEERSEENGKPAPAQLPLVVHADASLVHARILGRRGRAL